ncbi:MAG TPA: glucose-6-phosphate dehydrogenase [Steroidobacteraceae bacterium]|nr:glucose-6-phosphate dehydrogenase [Steroidobacteraceae bacterium]
MQSLKPFDFVLFGGTGDLAMRKLIPALYQRFVDGQFDEGSRILACASSALSRSDYLQRAQGQCREHLTGTEFSEARWTQFAACLDYQQVDATRVEDFRTLKRRIADRDEQTRVWFLSTSPSLYIATAGNMAAAAVATPAARVVLEKPLGTDRVSAARINEEVARSFAENQIYRIDHYLGKEPVQNLLALRFGNALFEPLWRRGRIRHVQITVAEHLGVEGRAKFYDETGALRDMVQNHMLQLLCILAMEPPASSDADTVRDEKLKVLRALRPIDSENVEQKTVRGQYRAGSIEGKAVPGYADEPGVPAGSSTETFVAIKAEIDNWRWAGVPFYLRTGKRLQQQLAEIAITFDDVPLSIFPNRAQDSPNQLVIHLQPDESITLTVLAKAPGDAMRLRPVNLALDLAESFKERPLSAYERLLMDVVKGNLTLFMRRDELDTAWSWIDPIRAGWANSGNAPKTYAAGSWGPAASTAMIGRDGYAWRDET